MESAVKTGGGCARAGAKKLDAVQERERQRKLEEWKKSPEGIKAAEAQAQRQREQAEALARVEQENKAKADYVVMVSQIEPPAIGTILPDQRLYLRIGYERDRLKSTPDNEKIRFVVVGRMNLVAEYPEPPKITMDGTTGLATFFMRDSRIWIEAMYRSQCLLANRERITRHIIVNSAVRITGYSPNKSAAYAELVDKDGNPRRVDSGAKAGTLQPA